MAATLKDILLMDRSKRERSAAKYRRKPPSAQSVKMSEDLWRRYICPGDEQAPDQKKPRKKKPPK